MIVLGTLDRLWCEKSLVCVSFQGSLDRFHRAESGLCRLRSIGSFLLRLRRHVLGDIAEIVSCRRCPGLVRVCWDSVRCPY